MNLAKALRIDLDPQPARIALVGAGGKTTALFQLAREMNGPVLVTTTTHIGAWQAEFAEKHIIATRPEDVWRNTSQIEGVTLVTGPTGRDERLAGPDKATLDAIYSLAEQFNLPLLVEADGARQRPLKAPAEHEPVIPGWIQMVVITAGLSGIGHPLDGGTVHRPELFARLSGLELGEVITSEGLAKELAHPKGGMKGILPSMRAAVLLNQAETELEKIDGLRVANTLTWYNKNNPAYKASLIASMSQQQVWRAIEPTAIVILAAGGSARLGQSKLLLPWHEHTLVWHVAQTALTSGVGDVTVVTGAVDAEVRDALHGLPVSIVTNVDWHSGQSTSVRTGLQSISENTGAVIFMLADQPFVSADLIQALNVKHQESLVPVVAARVGGKRANPVLFDRMTFPDLMKLEGDTGGRAIINLHTIDYVDWSDTRILLDIDTPEDLQHLQEIE